MSCLPFTFYNSNNFRLDPISASDDLTEEELLNIERNPDNQSWNYISAYKRLSIDFIQKYYNRLNISYLMENGFISPEVKEFCKMFM